MTETDQVCIDTLRFLSVDMVEKAKSGHPGLPLGAAPTAWTLWSRFLRHNPRHPTWPDRDRFLLSAGHGSALLYSLLHTTGYDLSLEDLHQFRQFGSRTPGHPEYGVTPGVEATTGPLGQGFAMGVGMAIAERFLGHAFNREGFSVIDHHTYALVSDGDLMEGMASEAASVAGTMGLGKLVYLYDDNHVSLEGGTELAFTEDVAGRFRAYHWDVQRVEDGNDVEAISAAIASARSQTERPNLIMVRTHIGYGSPVQDTREAHGEALGEKNTRLTKEKLGWPTSPTFLIPPEAASEFARVRDRGTSTEERWSELWEKYAGKYPQEAENLRSLWAGELPTGWAAGLPMFYPKDGDVATRDASSKLLPIMAARLPTLLGGSADLAPSTKTLLPGMGDMGIGRGYGRNIHFGVRENAMVGMVNGMALHGGVLPYGASFLAFSDYARPALRIAAIQQSHTIIVFTHDSIGLGEDGPTHQPIEQLGSLRLIPGMTVVRPADANETREAWKLALRHRGPVLLVFSRQKLPVLDPARFVVPDGLSTGAYILVEPPRGPPDIVLAATGSEVQLALGAAAQLASRGVAVRVVSIPCTEVFDAQATEFRESIFPSGIPRLFVEAGTTGFWWKYVKGHGDVVGIDHFGASGPGAVVLERNGFTVQNVVEHADRLLQGGPTGGAR
ncbi:MAG: transketolase [Thermoplasmata archaeon]